MSLHYNKQNWVIGQRFRQIFRFFKPISGGVGLVILCHEFALIKGETK